MSAVTLAPGITGRWYGPSDGPVVVALHGWSGDHRTFDPTLAHLPKSQRMLCIDMPGFGGSSRPIRWDFDTVCALLLDALDAQGVTRATLLGNCAGAVVGMELALRDPARFERLVLIDVFGFVPWYFRLLTAGPLGWLFYHATFANPVGRWITNRALAKQRTESTDLTEGFEAVRHDVAFQFLRMLCAGADHRRYAALYMPITLLHGERTFAAVRRSASLFTDLWPQSERFELAGAGHLPIQEAPAALTARALPLPPEGELDANHENRRLSHAPGDSPHWPDLGHHPGVGAAL